MATCPHHEAITVRIDRLEERMDETSEIQENILVELRGIKSFIQQGRTALYVLIFFLGAHQSGVVDSVMKIIGPLFKK